VREAGQRYVDDGDAWAPECFTAVFGLQAGNVEADGIALEASVRSA
jgi:hypothetical protein